MEVTGGDLNVLLWERMLMKEEEYFSFQIYCDL